MFFLFGSIKEFLLGKQSITENVVFKLHYNITFGFLLSCTILCTGYIHFGIPMRCMTRDDIPEDVIDTYCWIHNTFSVDNAWHKEVGEEVAYPGFGQYKKTDKRTFHSYYQWVPYVLMLQAGLCYLGKYIWSAYEDNLVNNIKQDLDNPVLGADRTFDQRKILLNYLWDNRKRNKPYFYGHIFAEIVNLGSILGQMFLMDSFLGGYFTTYGSDVLSFTEWDSSIRYDPMIRVFPRLAKCTFHRFGPSGDVQKHDILCVLPLNIVNEKIYVILWFWFIILFVLSCLSVIYRAFCAILPRVRFLSLSLKSLRCNQEKMQLVVSNVSLGNFMLLTNLSKNIDSTHFNNIICRLAERFDDEKDSSSV